MDNKWQPCMHSPLFSYSAEIRRTTATKHLKVTKGLFIKQNEKNTKQLSFLLFPPIKISQLI